MSLLLKKSWHPALMKNQARVYDAEQSEIAERKKTAARLQEIKEERAKEALQADLEKAGGKPRLNRVDWMYEGPSNGQNGTSEELEGFLLGKRRIDNLITRGSEQESLKKQAGVGPDLAAAAPKLNERDTAAKLREDPLLAIKRKEQEAYEAMLSDPIRRQQLLVAMGKSEEKQPSRQKGERHSRRHKHRSDSREHRHRRPRRSDSRDREDPEERRHRSRRSDSRDRSASRDRYETRKSRHDERPSARQRSESPERSRDAGRSRRDRSRSPRRSSHDGQEDRHSKRRRDYSDEPPRGNRRQESSYDEPRRGGRDGRYGNDRRRNDRYGGGPNGGASASSSNAAADAEEKARKLAAMQANASGLDQDRAKRLAELDEKERLAREADDRAREKSGKYGGDKEFAHGLRRQLINK